MSVLKTIENIKKKVKVHWKYFLTGGCYRFYEMLKEKYPKAEAYYDSNHVITKIDDKYYDVTGEVKKDKHISVDVYYSHDRLKKYAKKGI